MHKDKLSQDFYSHFFFKHLAEIVMNLQKCVFLWQILRFEYQIPAKLFLLTANIFESGPMPTP